MRRLSKILFFALAGALFLGDGVFAAEPGAFSRVIGVAYPDMRLVVIRVLQIVWLFVATGALGFLVYGYMLLRGADPDDLYESPRAKRMMLYSGIAAGASIIILIILTIAFIVIERGYKTAPQRSGGEEFFGGLGGRIALAEKNIRDHYPGRDERNVPRDTTIFITFSEKIKKESVFDTTNAVRRDSILIRRTSPTQTGDFGVVAATGVLDAFGNTLKIIPSKPLGEPDQKIFYTVALTSSILKFNNEPLFTAGQGGYSWQFEVSGLIDTTPPTVESYLPIANSQNPINTLIQATFSEPIDPFTVTPDNLVVLSGAQGEQKPIVGVWSVGNGYRTVTFASNAVCGTNQCGSAVFCLPAGISVSARLKAASLLAQNSRDNPNKASFPYSGIVDTAGNSLDGGGLNGASRNGRSEGQERDDFVWNFAVGSEKDTTQPTILSISPGRDAQGVSLTAPVTAIFSKFMDISSLNASSIGFTKELALSVSSAHVFSEKQTRAQIIHEPFKADEIYTPNVKSGVADITQNCYNPCAGPGVINTIMRP